MTLLRHLGAALIGGAVIWALSVQLNAFRDFQMAEIAVYVVAIAGLSLLIGLSGQISLGHGAFMAIGAYTGALLMLHLNWPLWAVFPASAAVTALAGTVVGLAAQPDQEGQAGDCDHVDRDLRHLEVTKGVQLNGQRPDNRPRDDSGDQVAQQSHRYTCRP